MPRSARNIETSMLRLKRLGGVLNAIFAALIIVTIIFGGYLLIVAAIRLGRGLQVFSSGLVEGNGLSVYPLPACIWFAIALFLEITAWSICRDMARGQSPFTARHARMIAALGVVFLLNAGFGLFFPGNVMIDGDAWSFFYWPNAMVLRLGGSGGVSFDFGSLLTALICFSASAMWRYAALLQAQADDLV